jgi:Ser/Thr protein kinase RdoA (MazF antagonist)
LIECGNNSKESVKAHGLDGGLVEPDWAPMNGAEIAAVLSRFEGLAEEARVLSVSPRPLSAACVVETRQRRLFVKRNAKTVRTAEQLREEHRYMAWLRAHGAPVPEVLRTAVGDIVFESEGWAYEVHAAAEGLDSYGDVISWMPFKCVEHARAAGAALAGLHKAAEGFDAPVRVGTPLVAGFTIYAASDPAAAMNAYLERWPALKEFVSGSGWIEETLELLSPFAKQLRLLLPQLQPLWTHNDLHASNLFWSGTGPDARVTSVIDFGLCDRTNSVHDIANAIERNCVEWLTLMNAPKRPELVHVHMDHVWALIDGYESVRQLSTTEVRSLAPMLAVCHVEFALSEAEYFLALQSQDRAKVACDDYMVGHARWWRGAGERVMDELRAWAERRRA